MRANVLIAILIGVGLPVMGQALSLQMPPVEETVREVSANGLLIRGVVIQGFDAKKRQPEIIRAEAIFIGEGELRDFVIYHSPSEYDDDLKPRDPRVLFFGPSPVRYKVGHQFDRLVLMPAKSTNGEVINGAWTIHFWGGNVARERGLEMLVQEATRLGRFRAHPPAENVR